MLRQRDPARGRACRFFFFLFLVQAATVLTAGAATPIQRVSFSPRADGKGLVVRIATGEPIQAYREPVTTPDNRVELMIFNAELAESYRAERPVAPVQAVHVEPVRSHLRITFALEPTARVIASAYRDRNSDDLLLGLEYVTDVARPLPVVGLPERSGYSAPDDATATPSVTGAYDTAAQRWRLDTIVIDAGHGGHDTGAVAHGYREKDLCLAVAKRLGSMIEGELGVDVVYTRETDRFITLRERGKIANESGGKLFISIHANAAHNGTASGTETFFLGMHKSEAARSVMERENSVIELETDQSHYTSMTDESLILQTLAHSAYMRKSEELAALVEGQLELYTTSKSRGVKQAGFYVLWSASMPAILVEMGFITNRREAEFLASSTGQEFVANAILAAVKTFKERYERDLHLVSP
ncbi:MAG TPA: N-acetylmuramoyl-L-alanine amidase [Rhodothermales bacterium]